MAAPQMTCGKCGRRFEIEQPEDEVTNGLCPGCEAAALEAHVKRQKETAPAAPRTRRAPAPLAPQ